jgi:hypothetical protein
LAGTWSAHPSSGEQRRQYIERKVGEDFMLGVA